MPYKQKLSDVWALKRKWKRQDVSDVTLTDIADVLAEKMLSHDEMSDLSAHNALFDPDWRVPLPPQYTLILEEICGRAGINASAIQELGLEWSAAVHPTCDRGNGPNPKFVKTCQDSLSNTYEVRQAIKGVQETLFKMGSVLKYSYYSLTGMALSIIPTIIYSIAKHHVPILLIIPEVACELVAWKISQTAFARALQCKLLYVAPFAHLEEAAIPRLARQWFDTAKQVGNWQVSIEDRFESLKDPWVNVRLRADPDIRLHDLLATRKDLNAKLRKLGWSSPMIMDLEALRSGRETHRDSKGVLQTPEAVINAIVEKTTRPIDKNASCDTRGLIIRLRPRAPADDSPLIGTELVLAALPPGPKKIGGSDTSNPPGPDEGEKNRPRRRGLGKVRGWSKKGSSGGWVPVPGTT